MTYQELWRGLTATYDEREAQAVARLVLERRFGLSLADVLCGRTADEAALAEVQRRLIAGEPVQYVLGEAEFGGRWFGVAPGVLIPRPETYELCQWIREDTEDPCSVLDIGTGSGCIACTLAAELPGAQVTAWDVSDTALAIARGNVKRLSVTVQLERVDVLNTSTLSLQPSKLNLLVSNPPYVCECEKGEMAARVLEHEPHLALFVPDDDPLLFYRAIADYGRRALTEGGRLYFEINPLYADELEQMLCDGGYTDVSSRRDQFGKTRFTRATRP